MWCGADHNRLSAHRANAARCDLYSSTRIDDTVYAQTQDIAAHCDPLAHCAVSDLQLAMHSSIVPSAAPRPTSIAHRRPVCVICPAAIVTIAEFPLVHLSSV